MISHGFPGKRMPLVLGSSRDSPGPESLPDTSHRGRWTYRQSGGSGFAAWNWNPAGSSQSLIDNAWTLTAVILCCIAFKLPGSAGVLSIRPCIDFSSRAGSALDLVAVEVHSPVESTGATIDHALAINVGQYVCIPGQQGLGRTHFRAQR